MARGGKREGAGRPSMGDRVLVSWRIDSQDRDWIRDMAREMGTSPGEVIHQLINSFEGFAAIQDLVKESL